MNDRLAVAAPDDVDSFLAEIGSMVGGTATSPWQQVWDETQQAYYYWHSQTNEVTWSNPAEPTPTEPVAVPAAKRKKPSRFGETPAAGKDVGDLKELPAATKPDSVTNKRSRSPSPPRISKASKTEEPAMKKEPPKSERAARVREMMLKLAREKEEKEAAAAAAAKVEEGGEKARSLTDDGATAEALLKLEILGLLEKVKEALGALPATRVIAFDPVDPKAALDGENRHTVHDAVNIVRAREHDWGHPTRGLRSDYFSSYLQELLSLTMTRAGSSTVVTAAPVKATTLKVKAGTIEATLPAATGGVEPHSWLIYLTPDTNASNWSAEAVATHFQTLRGLTAVRCIGQGFYALELGETTDADVQVQLTAWSMTVPKGTTEWRLLADRTVYARQASRGDSVALYPAVYSKHGPLPHEPHEEPPPREKPKEKPPKAGVQVPKKVSVKKLNPMVEKWQAAQAEIEVSCHPWLLACAEYLFSAGLQRPQQEGVGDDP